MKGHEVDDHGPTLVAHHLTSYTGDSDTEGKVRFIQLAFLFLTILFIIYMLI